MAGQTDRERQEQLPRACPEPEEPTCRYHLYLEASISVTCVIDASPFDRHTSPTHPLGLATSITALRYHTSVSGIIAPFLRGRYAHHDSIL
jgi:hypothetical protein